MRLAGFLLVVGGVIAAAGAQGQTSAPDPGALTKTKMPRRYARALGIVTSTVVQTKAQTPYRKPYNYYALLPEALFVAELEGRHAEGGPLPERLERLTRGLLGAPYLLSALGEGAGARPDPDPRLRIDAFDCTTFVETAIALAHRDHPASLRALLDRIRYIDGEAHFDHRRHLMTSQWIPGLVAEGWLEDVTARVAGSRTRTIHLNLTEKRWKKRTIARALVLPEGRVPRGTFDLDYIPVQDALTLADAIPAGTVVNVVRANWAGSPDVITHQGLVITRPGSQRRFVRHASPISRRVVDEPLVRMLKRYRDKPRKWSVVGINLLKVLPEPTRINDVEGGP